MKALLRHINEVFDIGTSTKNAIQNIKNGMNLAECGGSKKESDNGNGSLMRVLPLAYIGAFTEKKDLKKITESVSSLTHAHKEPDWQPSVTRIQTPRNPCMINTRIRATMHRRPRSWQTMRLSMVRRGQRTMLPTM